MTDYRRLARTNPRLLELVVNGVRSARPPHWLVPDLVQDAWVRILEHDAERTRSSPGTWCYGVARNWALYQGRSAGVEMDRRGELPELSEPAPDHESRLDARRRLEEVRRAPLTRHQYEVVAGVADGTTSVELGQRLGCSPVTVRRHLQDARKTLQPLKEKP